LPAPNVVVESNASSSALLRMVRTTDLLTIATASSLRHADGALRPFPLQEARWPRVVGITLRRGAYVSPLVQRFIELLQQYRPGDFAAVALLNEPLELK